MNDRNRGRGTGNKHFGAGRDVRNRPGERPGAGSSRRESRAAEQSPAYAEDSASEERRIDDEQWIAGKHPVLEALRSGHALNKIWIAEHLQRTQVAAILEEAKTRGVVVQTADKHKLDQMVPGIPHQGIVAQAAAATYVEVDDLLALAAERGEAPLLVLLDEVEDPHNLGSVLRTADCTGVHGVIVPKRRSASLTAVVAKTSAGAVEYVPVARVSNMTQTIERLKEAGVWVAGAAGEAQTDVYRANLTGPLAIVIGNEGRGLSRLVRESCDFLVSLPMMGRIHSLNASVAAGVILYEAVRQRREGDSALARSNIQGDGHAPT